MGNTPLGISGNIYVDLFKTLKTVVQSEYKGPDKREKGHLAGFGELDSARVTPGVFIQTWN